LLQTAFYTRARLVLPMRDLLQCVQKRNMQWCTPRAHKNGRQ